MLFLLFENVSQTYLTMLHGLNIMHTLKWINFQRIIALNTDPFNHSTFVCYTPKLYFYDVHVFMRLLHGGVLVDDVGSNVFPMCA